MDTTPEYIKMSEKARKIQEKAIHENGDFTYSKLKDRVVVLYYSEHHGKPPQHYIDPDTSTWLPRQDQLQKMIDEKWTTVLTRFIREMTYHAGYSNYAYGNNYDRSMEQLWLMFIMKEKYNKTWNGEDWVNP